MFLLEHADGRFVDAEKIAWINVSSGPVIFGVIGDIGNRYVVCGGHEERFLSRLQAMRGNISSLTESRKKHNNKEF